MDAVGIMLMWLMGIVAFPIVVYIIWKLSEYMGNRSERVQWIMVVLMFAVPLALYMGTSHIVDKGYCFRDGKYFSEYSKEEMINQAIKLLLNDRYSLSLEAHQDYRDFLEKIKSSDIENFKSFNDDCCHVYVGDIKDKEDGAVKYWYKLTGEFYGHVLLEYWLLRPTANMGKEQKDIYRNIEKEKRYYGINRCGEVFEIPNYLYF
ncbi:hypothetical protein [Neisseria dentiae]|uniref:hypothetical protein n=1 Tax=Neisseria dentiae TaxID=194197 RepID=UPI00359F618F